MHPLHAMTLYIAHPGALFHAVARHPAAGWALVGQAALTGAWVGAFEYEERMRGTLRRGSRELGPADAAGIGLCLVLMVVGLAAVTTLVLHTVGSAVRLDAVLALLVLALAPKQLSFLTSPLRNLSRFWWRVWQIGDVAALLWSVALLGTAMTAGAGIPLWWHGVVAASPAAALILFVAASELRERPHSIAARYPWRRTAGRRVVVFHPGGADPKEAAAVAAGCDRVLERVERALEVEPLRFRPYVFLVPDGETLRRVAGIEGRLMGGYAFGDSIGLTYRPWPEIESSVAHELGHVVSYSRVQRGMSGLLEEGLAEYARVAVCGREEAPGPNLVAGLDLRLLVRPEVFFDGLETERPVCTTGECYAAARSFARFLIQRHGIAKYKELCRRASARKPAHPGDRLDAACREVYGAGLGEIEHAWRGPRAAATPPNRPGDEQDAWRHGWTSPPTFLPPPDRADPPQPTC